MTSTKTTDQSATPASESVGGRVIDNAASGERIVIRKSGADTGGRVLAFDLFLRPGGHVPAGHVHPVQEERFTVIQGRMRFRLGRRTVLVGPGETVRIPAGTPHWFGNVGPDVAQIGVEVRPALRMEELLQRTGSLGTDGHFPGTHIPRLSDLAVVLLEFQRELAVPNVPAFLVRAVMAPLAWLARRRAHPLAPWERAGVRGPPDVREEAAPTVQCDALSGVAAAGRKLT